MAERYSEISKEDLQEKIYFIDDNNILIWHSYIWTWDGEDEWRIKKTIISTNEIIEKFPLIDWKQNNKFIFKWSDKLTLNF